MKTRANHAFLVDSFECFHQAIQQKSLTLKPNIDFRYLALPSMAAYLTTDSGNRQ